MELRGNGPRPVTKRNINRKLAAMIATLTFLLGIGISVIVDYAIFNELTWSLYPLLAISFAWIITMSALLKEKGQPTFTFIIFSILIVPFLYLLERITPASGWFLSLALPISILWIITLWVCYFAFLKLKVNIWIENAIIVFVVGVIASPLTIMTALNFSGIEWSFLSVFVVVFVCLIVSLVFLTIGLSGKKGKVAEERRYETRTN